MWRRQRIYMLTIQLLNRVYNTRVVYLVLEHKYTFKSQGILIVLLVRGSFSLLYSYSKSFVFIQGISQSHDSH